MAPKGQFFFTIAFENDRPVLIDRHERQPNEHHHKHQREIRHAPLISERVQPLGAFLKELVKDVTRAHDG